VQTLPDVIDSETYSKQVHKWEQPEKEAAILIRSLTEPGAVIADLTLCSGTTAVACASVGHRRFLGCDLDPDLVRAARARVAKALQPG
jgi:site-specific DNA-methyltransferase (adenine-specific)